MTSPAIQSYSLDDSVTVKLDGSGNGKAKWTPGQTVSGVANPGGAVPGRNTGFSVNLTGVAVSVATNTAEAEASCYVSFGVQSAGPNDFQGQTQTGSTGDTCTVNTGALRPGDWVTVSWIGGDANALATMKLFGTVNPPGGM